MLEGFVEPLIAYTERGKDVSSAVVACFFYVVVLKVNKLLIVDCAFGDLSVEESCVGFVYILLFTVLYKYYDTLLSFYPIRRLRLKLPMVTTELTFLSNNYGKKLDFSS
jgi:hypothetical protein